MYHYCYPSQSSRSAQVASPHTKISESENVADTRKQSIGCTSGAGLHNQQVPGACTRNADGGRTHARRCRLSRCLIWWRRGACCCAAAGRLSRGSRWRPSWWATSARGSATPSRSQRAAGPPPSLMRKPSDSPPSCFPCPRGEAVTPSLHHNL